MITFRVTIEDRAKLILTNENPPAKTPGDFLFTTEPNLTILLALLPALLTATTLLAALLAAALASGLLLLLTGLLLAALLLAALLLPALLHITHLVVRHGELSFAEGLRAEIIFLRRPCSAANKCGWQECRNHGASTPLAQIVGAPGALSRPAPVKWAIGWRNAILILEQLRRNPVRIAAPY